MTRPRTKTLGALALGLALLALLIMSRPHSPLATSIESRADLSPARESSAAILARYYPPAAPEPFLKIEARGDGFAPVFPEKKVDPKNRWSNPAKPESEAQLVTQTSSLRGSRNLEDCVTSILL